MNKEEPQKKNYEIKILIFIIVFVFFGTILVSSYAFFNYTRTGDTISTAAGVIYFNSNNGPAINIGNGFPLSDSDIDATISKTISLSSHTTYEKGIKYRIYAIPGDTVTGKTRLLDDVISLEFIPPADGNGFTTEINNYKNPKSLTFVDGKALISTGLIKNTTQLTSKSYNIKLKIDSNKINISSTTKRINNNEGNPSLADATTGTTTASRYMRNNTSESSTITLYPARENQEGKIIYTTNEFENSYYSIKIVIEAEDNNERPMVYLDTDGGTLSNNSDYTFQVTTGMNYPTLPTPTKTGYTFLGWNGKNLAIYSPTILTNDRVQNGITWHALSENTVHISGTATANSFLTAGMTVGSSNLRKILAGTYTISSNLDKKSSSSRVYLYGFYASDTTSRTFANSIYSNAPKTFTLTGDADTNIQMLITSGMEINQDVWVQIEQGNTATAYEPYFVNNTVTVTQAKDHVLKAIWQKNN